MIPGRGKRLLFVAMTALCSLGLSLIAAELLLRVAGYRFTVAPSVMQFGWPDPIVIDDLYRFDSDLFWVQQDYEEKLARWSGKKPTIAFLGDSCTEFGRYDLAFMDRLAGVTGDRRATFINLGVGGWSSYQGRRQLERDVVPLGPKVATIYFGWNDHWNTFGLEDKSIHRFFKKRDPRSWARRFRVAQLWDSWAFDRRAYLEAPLTRVTLEDYRENLTEMVRTARAHDVVPVLLTAPTSFVEGSKPVELAQRHLQAFGEVLSLHIRYVNVVREVASREQAPLVDLFASVKALPPKEVSEVLFLRDGIHLTPEGDQMVAKLLLEGLERNGLLPELGGDEVTHPSPGRSQGTGVTVLR